MRAVRHQAGDRASCCRSTTSREIAGRGRSARRRQRWRTTERVLLGAAESSRGLPEVASIQAYAGTAGAVQFQRPGAALLSARTPGAGRPAGQSRSRKRRAQARQPRHRARSAPAARGGCSLPAGTGIKVVEVPPGPPVLATLLAEIYGPDAGHAPRRRRRGARRSSSRSRSSSISTTRSASTRPRLRLVDRPGQSGILRRRASATSMTPSRRCSSGVPVGYSHRGEGRNPIEIAVQLAARAT
ncbi:MAG: hypothetical protein MZV49_18725 [Rhodopseudomonas palustris]|nr:hypothetical protein [Rhodopseudomonas palustris]